MMHPSYSLTETVTNVNKSPRHRQAEREELEEFTAQFLASGKSVKALGTVVRDEPPILNKTHKDLLKGNANNAKKVRARK